MIRSALLLVWCSLACLAALAAEPAPGNDPEQVEAQKKILEDLKDLGDPNRDKRRAALERAKAHGAKAIPFLIGILDPKLKTPSELRMGALRALAVMGPLDARGGGALGSVALHDQELEVRREAARTIAARQEKAALEYLISQALDGNANRRYYAAAALREINDDRVFAALAALLPEVQTPTPMGGMPPVTILGAAATTPADFVGAVQTVPALDTLRLIARKNLSYYPVVWANWLKEKTGLLAGSPQENPWRRR